MSSIADRELAQDWPTGAIPREWIDSLFKRMLVRYGNKFVEMWRGIDMEDVKREWASEMGKLNAAEMKAGVSALDSQEWPPTLPMFLQLCRASLDPVRAYYEAIEGLRERQRGQIGQWSHPAVYWAANGMAYELNSQSYSQLSARWDAALKAELAKGSWAPIPQPQLAIAAPTYTKANDATYRQAKAAIQRVCLLKNDAEFDHKRWAKRILQRAKTPGNRVYELQIEMAQSALRITEKSS